MKRLLVILQNAYGVEAGYVPTFSCKTFCANHTAKRLKEYLPAGVKTKIINATPEVGTMVDSNLKPLQAYVNKEIKKFKPDVILACGVNARKVVNGCGCLVIEAHHPSYRLLSKVYTAAKRQEIATALELYHFK